MDYSEFVRNSHQLEWNVRRKTAAGYLLQEAEVQFTYVRSPVYRNITRGGPRPDFLLERIQRIDERKADIRSIEESIRKVVEVIEEIPCSCLRYLVWLAYVDRVSFEEIASRINMNPDYMRDVLREQVKEALARYNEKHGITAERQEKQ